MALISSGTIISALSLMHLMVAYYLITDPPRIVDHNFVKLLSLSTSLPLPPALIQPHPLIPIVSTLLTFQALSDLFAAAQSTPVAAAHWASQTPLRLVFYFALSAYAYAQRPGGVWAGREEAARLALAKRAAFDKGSVEELLGMRGVGNGLVFGWAFLEMVVWFWVFITLRDERREASQRLVDKRKM